MNWYFETTEKVSVLNKYYVTEDNQKLEEIRAKKKEVLEQFSNQYDKIKEVMSEKKIKCKTPQDMVFLFNYYNTLEEGESQP